MSRAASSISCCLPLIYTGFIDSAVVQEASPIVIVANGTTEYDIVVHRESQPATLTAATELQTFLKRSTGVNLRIIAPTQRTRKAIVIRSDSSLPFDGFRIEVRNDDIIVTGHDTSGNPAYIDFERPVSCGTLYGVYELLESALGVRFYWPDELGTIVPQHTRFELPRDYRRVDSPHFSLRRLRYGPKYRNIYHEAATGMWGRRLRLGTSIPVCFYHAWKRILNVEEWAARGRPEYAALVNGQRQTKYDKRSDRIVGQLCTSNEEVLKLVANAASESSDLMFSISPNDGHICFCECSGCRALDSGRTIADGPWRGRRDLSNRIFTFYNEIARRSGRSVGGYAYKEYVQVPLGIALDSRVTISVVVNNACLSGDPSELAHAERILKNWGAYSPRASAYDILFRQTSNSRAMRDLIAPLGDDAVRRVKLIDDAGLSGAQLYIAPEMELGGSDAYVVARLMWDPSAKADEISNEYYRDLYGPGWKSIRELYKLAELRWRRAVAENSPPEFRGLMIDLVPNLRHRVRRAMTQAAHDSNAYQRLEFLAAAVERMGKASRRPDGWPAKSSR